MSAPDHNTNAQKGEHPADTHLALRISRPRKAAYVRNANKRREKLAEWVVRHLDTAAGYKETGNK